jgi:hypothetical protein
MLNSGAVLVVHRRTRILDPASLHCREIDLRLGDDGRHVTLSRYVEFYSNEHTAWRIVRHHRVALKSMMRWMIANGEDVKSAAGRSCH